MRLQKKLTLTVNELATDFKIMPNTYKYKDLPNFEEEN